MGLFSSIAKIASPIIGGLIGSKGQKDAAAQNAAVQKEFAQYGIRWKVADAKAAGIHPLYALGANTIAASPVHSGDAYLPNAISQAGQNLGRAIDATRTNRERQEKLADLQLEKAGLENDLLRSQISNVSRANNPAFPAATGGFSGGVIAGQGDSTPTATGGPNGYINDMPLQRTVSEPGSPAKEVGAVTDYGFVRTPTGLAVVPSQDVKQRIEDQLIPEMSWAIRNQFLPFFKGLPAPSSKHYKLPKGYTHWEWTPSAQEFRPARKEKGVIFDNYFLGKVKRR